ncbi:MAG: methyltransferase domain-containing protein [Ignavibacteriales bacterium]|nr:MAG: methyltransferase domain-containing protein [Ignavibacteriales bacterium]
MQDNRKYNYDLPFNENRTEYDIVISFIKSNSLVIDLGCGNGALLHRLIKEKSVSAKGLELSPSGVEVCKAAGLDVQTGSIDQPLPFNDNTFDYAICNVTIQMVMYPEILLSEMKRIAKHQIISFPNFAFYKNRIDLLLNGRMPQNGLFGYQWFDTGHIHQLSIKDFELLVECVGGLEFLEKRSVEPGNPVKNFLIKSFPNLFEQIPVFLLRKTK